MFDTKNRYGRMLNGNWYGLNNFSVGANVALEEKTTTEGKCFYGAAAQGLVGDKLVDGKMVDPEDSNVVLPYFSGEAIHPYKNGSEIDNNKNLSEYYNGLQFPFKQTKDKNGVITYSYDSGKDYAVYYNFEKNCFYESPEHIKNETTNDGTAPEDGFYPLNKPGDPRKAVNMGFGTEFTIPFTLSKDGKINGQDITFNFTGDDDVWVFIDDYLVLDMGGAHRMASGTIDFAEKNVTVESAFTPDKSTTAAWKDGATRANQTSEKRTKKFTQIKTEGKNTFEDIMADDSKVHTLKMFYMERGMFDSNMSVSFNFSPIPSGLTLSKDVDTKPVNDGLKSVVETKDNFDFTVKDNDTTRTEYTYEKDYNGTGTERNTTTDGVVEGLADNVYAKNFEYTEADDNGNKGLIIGTGFTITETENSNYNTRWFVTDISTGKTTNRGDGLVSTFKLGDVSSGLTKVNYNVNFVNTPKVGTVNITKAWDGDVPDTLKNTEFPFKVEVDLDGEADEYGYSAYPLEYTVDGNDYVTDANGNFTLKSGQTAAFEGIPTGAKVKVTETKTTDGKSWVVSGQEFKESAAVTDGSNEILTITNATMTIPSDKVIYVEAGKDTFYKPANVETGYTVSNTSDGLTYTDKGFNGAEPNKSYTANYTGSNSDGAIVNGTITVLTYQATDKVYVFDYGLESNIAETNANGDGLFQGGKFYNEEAKGDMATSAKLGTITPAKENTQTTISSGSNIAIDSVGKADGAVTFKPIAFMDKVENYKYTANIAKVSTELDDTNPETGTTVHGTIKTMPANVVYYEDNFNATNENDDSSVKIVYTNSGSKPTNDPTYSQSNDQSENYGHDKAYNGDLEESGNSATEMNNGDGAYFTFTGDGFDIVSRTNENTAGLIAYVYNGKKDAEYFRNPEVFKAGTKDLVKSIPVDTFYSNGDLYQVPVISTTLQQRGTYTVYLKALKTYTGQSVIYIDGVRIYNPLADKSAYLETEKNTKVQELRGMLLGSSPSINLVTPDGNNGFLIDGGSTAVEQYLPEKPEIGAYLGAETLADVMKAGPNNELYLPIDNGVAFKVSTPVGDADWTLQVGAKSVSADTSTESDAVVADKAFTVYVKPDDVKETKYQEVKNYTINTSTDMYYDIDLKEVIKAQGWTADSYDVIVLNTTVDYNNYDIISLTNIKCAADMTLSKPSQLTRMGYNLAGRNVLTGNDEAVLSAKFGVTNVTRGKYASMTVVTKKEATDVQVTDPTGAVVTSFTKKTSSIDADGNKEWKLTFKVIKQRGEAKYSVDAVVNGSLTNMPYSTSIMVR